METSPMTIADLEERVGRLERRNEALVRQNRRLIRSGAALLGLITLGATAGAAFLADNQQVLRARRLEIFDARGELRGVLGLEAGSDPALKLIGATGSKMVDLHVSNDVGELFLNNEPNQNQVLLIAGESGSFIFTRKNVNEPLAKQTQSSINHESISI